MHDRDTSHANPLAAPIEREPISPEPADPRIIRSQAYTEGLAAGRAEAIGPTASIEDVRHLAAMARAQGRVEGINEERVRDIALIIAHLGIITDDFTSPAKLLAAATKLLAAIRSGEAAP